MLPPPSKRQRIATAERARKQQDIDAIPDNLGSIRVQFHDRATGKSAGPPVSVQVADATVKNLELLLNELLGNVSGPWNTSCALYPPHTQAATNPLQDPSERVPYRFTYRSERIVDPSKPNNDLDVSNDIYHSLLKPELKTTEESVDLKYDPQAIFRVRAVSPCPMTSVLCKSSKPISLGFKMLLLYTGSRKLNTGSFFLSIILLQARHWQWRFDCKAL